MDDQDPAPFWRLLLIMALLGVAFWIWLAVALLLPFTGVVIYWD